ncbi:MAG: homoserine dehydrogenase [Actinomycetota bacterium]
MSDSSDSVVSSETVRVGLLGCGIVGTQLVTLIEERSAALSASTGLRFELARIAVRSTTRDRGLEIDPELLTSDAETVVNDPSVDVVVEVIGGIEPARSLILTALKNGKPVVTANKELLANHGAELYGAAASAGVDLLFEAAAAGAIPIVRPLRESLLGEDVRRVMGIVNGTTNYILTRMSEEGVSYGDALTEAQNLGYAERDPTADVEGFDAGAKAAIMATIAFGANVVAGDVYHEGISAITQGDIEFADQFDYTIKLLAIAELFEPGDDGAAREIGVRVYPAMVPNEHPLASVRGSFNAVFVEGEAAGELMFYGRGAGGMPTASAVLGDLVDAATNLRRGSFRPVPFGPRAKIRSIDGLESAYYVGVTVTDNPGVLSLVAGVFGQHDVSIRAMQQQGSGDEARLAFITHVANERNVQATLSGLRQLDQVSDIHSVLRVIDS